jgi:hypothetical protein
VQDKERLPWFPCYPDKLLGALSGMKPTEQLVYVIILLRIYESGGACRDSLDAIAIRCRLNKRVVSDALNTLFQCDRLRRESDGIRNPKADVVLADSISLHQERKNAGRKGASARWKKVQQNQSNGDSKAIAEPLAKNSYIHLQEQDSLFPNGNKALVTSKPTEEAELFRRGKELLGPSAGGFIKKLLSAKRSVSQARAAVEAAFDKNDPREYLGAVIRGTKPHERDQTIDGRL